MTKLFYVLSLYLACLSISMGETPPPRTKNVIIIGIDGLGTYGVLHTKSPHMKYMMENGAFTLKARAVLPTISAPNWMSMISGAPPAIHGVVSNAWRREIPAILPVEMGEEEIFPTIFTLLHRQRPQMKSGLFYQWAEFVHLFETSKVHRYESAANEEQTIRKSIDYLLKERPNFLFIQLDHVDEAGHAFGHRTQQYYQAVEKADELIGQIVEASKESGMFEDTVFIVTSDHGGEGKGHGGESLAELEIPFIIFGKGIKQGYTIKHLVNTFDTAATVADLFGMDIPYSWLGRPVKSAYQGEEGPAHSEIPNYDLYKFQIAPQGGLFKEKSVQVQFKAMGEMDAMDEQSRQNVEKGIYYTLDGSIPTLQSLHYQGPFQVEKDTILMAKYISNQRRQQGRTEFAQFRIIQGQSLIQAKYYEIPDLTYMPDLSKFTATGEFACHEFALGEIPHRDVNFAVQLSGKLNVVQEGEYTFFLRSDDGSQLAIDGKKILDHGEMHGPTEKSAAIHLTAGIHPIQVDYFQHAGGSQLMVQVRGPQMPKQILPPSFLVPLVP